MKKRFSTVILFLVVVIMISGITGLKPFEIEMPESSMSSFDPPSGFERAEAGRVWEFPLDYGPHPEYQTEWWYYTGNWQSEAGERFGYQLTFFRRGLLPVDDRIARQSEWGTDQVYMAHFALSDIDAKEHYAFERFSREALGLSGAQAEPYQVWLEDWQVSQIENRRYQLTAAQDGISLDLTLEDIKDMAADPDHHRVVMVAPGATKTRALRTALEHGMASVLITGRDDADRLLAEPC